MRRLFQPNIDGAGRAARALIALLLFAGAAFSTHYHWWLAVVLLLSGVFVLFEAVRGWCAFRACGIRTRL